MPTLTVLVLAYLLSQFYRSFLAVVAPELAAELSLDAAALGRISAAFFITFAAAQFFVGWSLDRFGPRRTVSTMMLSAVAGAAVLALAKSGLACLVALALMGLGCASIYMGSLLVIGRLYAPERFATLSGVVLGLGQIGNFAAATPLAAAIEAFGWRATLAGTAAVTLLSALAVFFVVRDPARAVAPEGSSGKRSGFAEVLSIRALWFLFPAALTAYATAAALRGLWIGPYLHDVFGLDALGLGNAATIMVLAMTAGAFICSPMDRIFGTRKWVVMAGLVMVTAALGALALWPAEGVVTATVLLSAVGFGGMVNSVIMAHGRAFLPDHLLGRGMAFLNLAVIGGVGLLQPISGMIVRDGLAAGRTAAAVYGDLFAFLFLLLAASLVTYAFSKDAPIARRA